MILVSGVSLSLFVLFITLQPESFAQQHTNKLPSLQDSSELNIKPIDETPSKTTLYGGVADALHLPEELFDTWQVSGTLLSTNNPRTFNQYTTDIWLLEQKGDLVRLSNPDTKSDAYVTVQEINGNTATFISKSEHNKKVLRVEKITITVNGNKFTGNNIFQLQYYRKNRLVRIDQALFTLIGTRISSAKKPQKNNSGF